MGGNPPKQVKDEPQEYEMLLQDGVLVAIPVKDHYLVSLVDTRDKKKDVREFAERMKSEG